MKDKILDNSIFPNTCTALEINSSSDRNMISQALLIYLGSEPSMEARTEELLPTNTLLSRKKNRTSKTPTDFTQRVY